MSGSLAALRLQGLTTQPFLRDLPSPSLVAAAYFQLSDVRTAPKRKRSDPDSGEQAPLTAGPDRQARASYDMPPIRSRHPSHQSFPDECGDLVVDCDGKECRLPHTHKPINEECTEQCVVVQCAESSPCREVCTQDKCQAEPCQGGDSCTGGFEEFLQCCTELHPTDTSETLSQNLQRPNWESHTDFWNLGNQPQLQASQLPSQVDYNAFNPNLFPSVSQNMGPLDMFAQLSDSSMNFAQSQQAPSTSLASSHGPSNEASLGGEFKCRWDNCHASFASLNELVGHVNVSHLCGPAQAMSTQKPEDMPASPFKSAIEPLSCHWDHCHSFSNSSTLPGPSTGLQPAAAMDQLTSHLFLDHLGISIPHYQMMLQNPSAKGEFTAQAMIADFMERQAREGASASKAMEVDPQQTTIPTPQTPPALTYSTPAPSPPPQVSGTDPAHDCATAAHICHWKNCGASFDTCAALTDHLNAVHVGGGRSRYDCHWGDCGRSGAAGFASKQKIMRHLQAHTGHRPFTCSECGLHFSEAATLQQHMRRHTQEKPFVCDFPGCGKAFAITGALTIHKRTHNGERPFKCPHCPRAFAESSNLSKHLRTHTGDKPYHCPEPGCGKAFARPDQLQRHANVHSKKKGLASPAESVERSDTGSPSM